MGSVIAYADWMKSGEPDDWESSELLRAIRDYNKDDCDSTWELAEWLGVAKRKCDQLHPLGQRHSQGSIRERCGKGTGIG